MPYCVTIGISCNLWRTIMTVIEWAAVTMITLFGAFVGAAFGAWYIIGFSLLHCPKNIPSLL
jgi:hypothetical protein